MSMLFFILLTAMAKAQSAEVDFPPLLECLSLWPLEYWGRRGYPEWEPGMVPHHKMLREMYQ